MSTTTPPVQLAAAVAILRVAYPGEFSDESVVYYVRKLADLDPADVHAAVDRLTNRMRFRPTVADIRIEVAEARLGLPTLPEAWAIAEKGSLRDAPACVREAVEFVGGRWAITTSENPSTIRAQFRHAYERTREQALLDEAGALAPRQLPQTQPVLPPPAELERLEMPYALMRHMAIERGDEVGPPTEEEMADAIRIMRSGPWSDDPNDDMLYKAAEHVFAQAADTQGGTT